MSHSPSLQRLKLESSGDDFIDETTIEHSSAIDDEDEDVATSDQDDLKSEDSMSRDRKFKQYYNDEYLSLLRTTHEDPLDESFLPLQNSQVGAVFWTAKEKECLFASLSTTGPYDCNKLADGLRTKSQLEIRDYLLRIQAQEKSRSKNARFPEFLWQDEIPSAAELSEDLIGQLNRSADAVASQQVLYDNIQGENQYPGFWLINKDISDKLQPTTEDSEQSFAAAKHESEVPEISGAVSVDPTNGVLNIPNWIELMNAVFMNFRMDQSGDVEFLDSQQPTNPSMTYNAIADFYQELLELLRRIMQSAIFMAQSRIRASQRTDYEAQAVVKEQDVFTAIEILGLNSDNHSYWQTMPRRLGLKISRGGHKKGGAQILEYDEIENALAGRSGRGRTSRRGSSAISPSSVSDGDTSAVDVDFAVRASSSSEAAARQQGSISVPSSPASDRSLSAHISEYADSIESTAPESVDTSQEEGNGDDDDEIYLEELDMKNSAVEEARLWRISRPQLPLLSPRKMSLSQKSKLKRERPDGPKDLSDRYRPPWQMAVANTPEKADPVNGEPRKRRKTSNDNSATLPFRPRPFGDEELHLGSSS